MKKLVNRVMATVLASSCMFSSVAMNSNAKSEPHFPFVEKVKSEEYLLANGYTKFDDHGMLHSTYNGSEVIGTYIKGDSYYVLNRQPAHIYIDLPQGTNMDEFTDMLYDRYPPEDGYWYYYPGMTSNNQGTHYTITDNLNKMNLPGNARNIMNDVIGVTEIYGFTYADSIEWVEEVVSLCDDITDYLYITEDNVEKLQNFVEENNLDFTVEVSDIEKCKRCHLIPNEGMTIDEQFAVAARIRKELKFDVDPKVFLGSIGGMYLGEDEVLEVDVLNALESDANEDGNVNIADATAIVQAIGNPDKYKLTAQGEFNADADGNGLSGADAIAIQMKLVEAGMPK